MEIRQGGDRSRTLFPHPPDEPPRVLALLPMWGLWTCGKVVPDLGQSHLLRQVGVQLQDDLEGQRHRQGPTQPDVEPVGGPKARAWGLLGRCLRHALQEEQVQLRCREQEDPPSDWHGRLPRSHTERQPDGPLRPPCLRVKRRQAHHETGWCRVAGGVEAAPRRQGRHGR